jgi:hypothetical protein
MAENRLKNPNDKISRKNSQETPTPIFGKIIALCNTQPA